MHDADLQKPGLVTLQTCPGLKTDLGRTFKASQTQTTTPRQSKEGAQDTA